MKKQSFSLKMSFALKSFLSLLIISFFSYKYIDKLNGVTSKRREIPLLQIKVQKLEEENIRLQYEIDKQENPAHLMHFARRKEFNYLQYPRENDVILLQRDEK